MKRSQQWGILLGIVGGLFPWIFPLGGLDLPARITFSIVLLAAAFWIFEPIPIYVTSLLVIFLEVLFLSAEGPFVRLFSPHWIRPVPIIPSETTNSLFRVPSTALTPQNELILQRKNQYTKCKVLVKRQMGNQVIVQSLDLSSNVQILADASHWLARYQPLSYQAFYGILSDPIIILFLGGCMLAEAASRYRVDRALTRLLLQIVGSKTSMVVLGFLLTSAVLSAFMSNTATTAMMIPVLIPILRTMPEEDPGRVAVTLAIPFGASLGGILTPIGTPPNALGLGFLAQEAVHIPFVVWMELTGPIVIGSLLLSWAILLGFYRPRTKHLSVVLTDRFDRSAKAIGFYLIFGLTVLLWLTEKVHGVKSSIVAFFPVVALPMFGIVGKEEIRRLPWEVFWLMAGGIALGIGMEKTGLGHWLVSQVHWSAFGMLGVLIGFGLVCFVLTNLISNTVTVALLGPIVMSLFASGCEMSTRIVSILLTVTVVASYGMALPISTPPNAIAMGTGAIETRHLFKAGGVIGLLGMIGVIWMARFYWPLFGF